MRYVNVYRVTITQKKFEYSAKAGGEINGGDIKADCGLCDRGRVASVICKSVGGREREKRS